MYLQQQTGLCSLEGIEALSGGAPGCVFLCKMWRGGGWFLAGNHCRDTSNQQVPPRHATQAPA